LAGHFAKIEVQFRTKQRTRVPRTLAAPQKLTKQPIILAYSYQFGHLTVRLPSDPVAHRTRCKGYRKNNNSQWIVYLA
jgi:hypothetical protein